MGRHLRVMIKNIVSLIASRPELQRQLVEIVIMQLDARLILVVVGNIRG